MNNAKLGLKVVMPLLALAGLSMGNQSCEQPTPGRTLKMEIELASLKARPVTMPTGEKIDFPYVANSLFYRQIMDHDHFVIENPVPNALSYYKGSGTFKMADAVDASSSTAEVTGLVSPKDVNVLDQFGFLKSSRGDGSALLDGRLKTEDYVSGKSSVQAATMPACLYELPQALLGGEVISFEATWGAGVGIGYGKGGDLTGAAAGSVDFNQSRLELGLRTDDPLTQQVIALGDGISHQSKVKFGFNFGLSGVPIGLNFFFNTPITDVIKRAMNSGLDNIVERYTNLLSVNRDWNEVWESRVIYDPEIVNNDTHIAFRGGYRSGVQVGDTFQVTNLHYAWEGTPCYTRLKYKVPLTVSPLAEAQVVSVGDNVSVAVITKYLIDQRIQPGAQVKVLKLKEPVKPKK